MSRSTDRLAILGGSPAFEAPRHVGLPNIPDRARLHQRLDQILDSRRLSNDGPFVRQLEEAVAQITGAAHAVAMCNATIAMQVLYRALGLVAGGEVIMPAFTFVATAHAARWEGLRPVFADVDPLTHNLSPDDVEARITPRTSAIMGVHLWGRCCDTDALQSIANEAGVPLLFDAAHALGSTCGGRPIGLLGVASVISLHATKVVHSGEGGVVLTNDGKLAERLRLMRNFGFKGYDSVASLGTNAKLSELAAVMGLGCLESFADFVETNILNKRCYVAEVDGVPGLDLLADSNQDLSNAQYVVGRIDASRFGLTRDEVVDALHAENILARRYFTPGCHRVPPYAGDEACLREYLPVTERLAAEVIVLPTGTGIGPRDIEIICARIRALQVAAGDAHTALARRRGSDPAGCAGPAGVMNK